MKNTYLGALDQGTTSTRFIIFDKCSNIISQAALEHKQIYPKPGWVEHDANEIIENAKSVIKEAVAIAGIEASDIKSIGITNQRESTVAWDKKTGEALHNVIVWQDMRTEMTVNKIITEHGKDYLKAHSGLPIATYFSALKMSWLLSNVKAVADKAKSGDLCFGTMDEPFTGNSRFSERAHRYSGKQTSIKAINHEIRCASLI